MVQTNVSYVLLMAPMRNVAQIHGERKFRFDVNAKTKGVLFDIFETYFLPLHIIFGDININSRSILYNNMTTKHELTFSIINVRDHRLRRQRGQYIIRHTFFK